jgi:hypothetical protein
MTLFFGLPVFSRRSVHLSSFGACWLFEIIEMMAPFLFNSCENGIPLEIKINPSGELN